MLSSSSGSGGKLVPGATVWAAFLPFVRTFAVRRFGPWETLHADDAGRAWDGMCHWRGSRGRSGGRCGRRERVHHGALEVARAGRRWQGRLCDLRGRSG